MLAAVTRVITQRRLNRDDNVGTEALAIGLEGALKVLTLAAPQSVSSALVTAHGLAFDVEAENFVGGHGLTSASQSRLRH